MQVIRGLVLTTRNLSNQARFQSASTTCADRMRHTGDRVKAGREQDIREGRIVRMKERKGAGDKKGPEGRRWGCVSGGSGCVSECCVLS